ncbi:SAM-dependent methyltransferase [Sulfuricystis multivorans]|uniref:SAM-dependent methyltransferase n=1 Tax=Sulfuricystis multivorans TaxID=2211108 RepID=UPI000F81E30E|nr:SAM-dependent methyltransferase [Sulfuricystis multivorans]
MDNLGYGTLYLLPTRLGEVPWPAVLPAGTREIACRLCHFVVENAKSARAALKWLDHPGPLHKLAIEELPASPAPADLDRLLAPLLAGQDMGVMSEAGCPGVADPGALLVRRAHELGIPVRPLVGPSSLLLALMASGLEGQRFAFHGYLPRREPERSQHIAELERESRQKRQTQLFIETPYRNAALLEALITTCRADTLLCLACDLTLPTEQIVTRRIIEWRCRPDSADSYAKRPTVFLLLSAA